MPTRKVGSSTWTDTHRASEACIGPHTMAMPPSLPRSSLLALMYMQRMPTAARRSSSQRDGRRLTPSRPCSKVESDWVVGGLGVGCAGRRVSGVARGTWGVGCLLWAFGMVARPYWIVIAGCSRWFVLDDCCYWKRAAVTTTTATASLMQSIDCCCWMIVVAGCGRWFVLDDCVG